MTKTDFIAAAGDDFRETPQLLFVGGYKYQSRNDMIYWTAVRPPKDIITDMIVLRRDGWLWVSKYFAWDGCSGPTIDDSTNMRGGQAHDALYALLRMGLLPMSCRPLCDAVLRKLMLQDNAMPCRAKYYEWAVNKFGGIAAKKQKPVETAPKLKGAYHENYQPD